MVSVIIPAFNVEQYIEDCVNSVLRQTYTDVELIIVDDGSGDGTGSICRRLADENSGIIYIRQENCGVSCARNIGIDNASGEYIMFLDGDDCLNKDIILRLMEEKKENADITCCCCRVFGKDVKYDDHFFDGNRSYETVEDKNELYLQLLDPKNGQPGKTYTGIGVPWGKLYRAEFIKNNGLRFDPELKRLQDNDFNMHAFASANKIVYINEPLYEYRVEHILDYHGSYRSPENNEKIISRRNRFFENNPLYYTEQVKQEYEKYLYKSYVNGMKYYVSQSKTYNRSVRRSFIKMTEKEIYDECWKRGYKGELLHEGLLRLLIGIRAFLLVYCLLYMTL